MAECRHPWVIGYPSESRLKMKGALVPCGKCMPCKRRRRRDWTFRLKQELKEAKTAYFVTLTYSNDYCPEKPEKEHIQNYIKRVRRGNGLKMKYVAVAERGSKGTMRPHYHLIMFNVSNEFELCDKWDMGFVHVGAVNEKSIQYVLKYMLKSQDKSENIPPSQNEGGEMFSLISKGIGKSYIDKNMEWHKDGLKSYVMNKGYKQGLPRYYRDKVFNEDEKEMLFNEYLSVSEDKKFEHLELCQRLGDQNVTMNAIAKEIQEKNRVKNQLKRSKL